MRKTIVKELPSGTETRIGLQTIAFKVDDKNIIVTGQLFGRVGLTILDGLNIQGMSLNLGTNILGFYNHDKTAGIEIRRSAD